MRHATCRRAVIVRGFAVAASIGFMVSLCVVAPALAKSLESSEDPCVTFNVPFCSSEIQVSLRLQGWETRDYDVTCSDPQYPYAWGITYTQTGSPSISNLDAIFATTPGTIGILMTNWNPFQTDDVTVTLACSKNNSFGGICGGPVSDPGCPVVAGSEQNHCSPGPVPVCILTYQERCQPANQLYQCTNTLGIAYCQQCPG
jgi:hypothetical protein